jgi:4-aminobutyrate aminotransferase/(S)-3-amino-2-methylpropionate transaminase
MASNKAFVQGEPDAPVLKASIPGPQSQKRIDELSEVFDTRSINMMTDFTKSIGNYISDPDGNYLLDV